MLTNLNVRNALETAKQLKAQGLDLACAEGSPLKELVEASLPISIDAATTMSAHPQNCIKSGSIDNYIYQNDDAFVDSVADATRGYSGENGHTLRIASLADQIAPFVTSHIAFARNTVVPLITEAEKAFTGFLSMASVPAASAEFKIIKAKLPDLVFDESFVAAGLENFNGPDTFVSIEPLQYKVNFAIPEDLDGFIASVKNQGSDRLNGLVDQWLLAAPADLLKRVFLVNFTKDGVGLVEEAMKAEPGYVAGSDLKIYDLYLFSTVTNNGSAFSAIHTSLAQYLLTTYLSNNPMKTVVDLDLAAYKNTLEEARIVAGTVVNRLVKRIKTQKESNVLVSEYSNLEKRIVVNADIYNAWLEQGGVPEALLGFLVSNQYILDAGVALESKEKGIRSWNIYAGIKTSEAEENIKSAFRAFVRNYMQVSLAELTSFETEFCPSEKPHRERVMALVDEQIKAWALTITENPGHLALHLVAKCRFYFTSAFTLLDEMRLVSIKNPDIDPREAAGMAMISYITEYLASQIGNYTQA